MIGGISGRDRTRGQSAERVLTMWLRDLPWWRSVCSCSALRREGRALLTEAMTGDVGYGSDGVEREDEAKHEAM